MESQAHSELTDSSQTGHRELADSSQTAHRELAERNKWEGGREGTLNLNPQP